MCQLAYFGPTLHLSRCRPTLCLAAPFSDNAVLQRAPAHAAITGSVPEGWGGAGRCFSQLQALCVGVRRSSVGNCWVCEGSHRRQLEGAGCQSSDLESFCEGAAPTARMTVTVALVDEEGAGRGANVSAEVRLGLGRIVALYYRASNSYQIHEHVRCLYF